MTLLGFASDFLKPRPLEAALVLTVMFSHEKVIWSSPLVTEAVLLKSFPLIFANV